MVLSCLEIFAYNQSNNNLQYIHFVIIIKIGEDDLFKNLKASYHLWNEKEIL